LWSTACMTSMLVAPSKGRLPVSISNIVTPSAHRSARASTCP
jgi:hypothetical protein